MKPTVKLLLLTACVWLLALLGGIAIVSDQQPRYSATAHEPRSPEWPKVRAKHLRLHPTCRACGGTHKLQVHHRLPFHRHPELELDPTNLVTLCGEPRPCHLWLGHLDSYDSWNVDVFEDSDAMRTKIENRPK